MLLCHRLGTVDAIPHLNGVEVDLHDALLRPQQFDEHGEVSLKTFPHPRATRPQEHILRRLLRDGRPVFVDIDPETLDIDASKIEEKITCHTVAIMPVHVFGNNCDFKAIDAVAKAHNIPVIYDACHSVGATYKGESVFKQGDISVTSFHATKMLNTAEGGGVFTLNKEIDEKLRRIRFFGFENHADIVEDGFNGKMTEVHAAVGLANLRYLDKALADRREKYARYKEILGQNPEIFFQKITTGCNYSYFPAIFKNEATALKVVTALNSENIYPRRKTRP